MFVYLLNAIYKNSEEEMASYAGQMRTEFQRDIQQKISKKIDRVSDGDRSKAI